MTAVFLHGGRFLLLDLCMISAKRLTEREEAGPPVNLEPKMRGLRLGTT